MNLLPLLLGGGLALSASLASASVPLTVLSEEALWSGISTGCRIGSGLLPGETQSYQEDLDLLSLEQWSKEGRLDDWLKEAKEGSPPPCTPGEVLRVGEVIRRMREIAARRLLKRLLPQLEAVAAVRPPTRELDLLRTLRKRAGIADGDFYPKGFKRKLRARGREAARNRKESCTTVTPQAIAPDQALDRARRQSRGWCFAFSTADLLSAKLGVKISGSALAASYYRDRPFFSGAAGPSEVLRNFAESSSEILSTSILDKEGGFLTRVLATALDQGFACSEQSVPSEVALSPQETRSPRPGDLEERYDEALRTLERIHDEITDQLFDHPRYGPPSETLGMPQISSAILEDAAEIRRLRTEFYCEDERLRESLERLFPRVTFEDFLKVAIEVPKSEAFEELARKGCQAVSIPKGRFRIGFKQDESEAASAGLKLIRALDRQLDGSNPVIIAYSSNGLSDPELSHRAFLRVRPRLADHAPVFDHASLVAGRMWSDLEQTCLYQIKNSWGEDCTPYTEAARCERGTIWVKEDHLRDMISEVAWLEDRSPDRIPTQP
jgi:hypothetical protein